MRQLPALSAGAGRVEAAELDLVIVATMTRTN